jgi:hypothetical protein
MLAGAKVHGVGLWALKAIISREIRGVITMQTAAKLLTAEQQAALGEYAGMNSTAMQKGEECRIAQVRGIIEEILAKRDELMKLFDLQQMKIYICIYDHYENYNLGDVSYILAQAVEASVYNEKPCSLEKDTYGNVAILDKSRELDITVFGAHKK